MASRRTDSEGELMLELMLWSATADGYVGRTLASDVNEATVGDFLGDGSVQVLFADPAGNLWLLPTPTADMVEPLAVQGSLDVYRTHVLDFGVDGRDELVSTVQSDEGIFGLSMHNVEPCD